MASLKAIIVTTLVMLVPFVPVTAVAITHAGPGLMRHEGEVEVEGPEPSMVQTEAHECSVNDETNCCFTAEGVDFTGNHKDRIPEGVSIYVGMCAYGASAAAPELWKQLAPLLKTCDTDACTRVAPQVPADKKCKDYKCPEGFNGHTPGSDDRPCENPALCDFNCCEVDINSDKRRRNGYLTFGVIMALQNVSKTANEVGQRKNLESPASKGPQSHVSELLDNAAGLYHVMHRVMGEEKANDLCKDDDFSSFRACVHSTICVIEKYTRANPEADNEEIKTYTLLVELYEDFKTLTWEKLNVDLLDEGADESLGNFEFVPQSELTGGCDGFTSFLGALKSEGLLETDSEESSEVAAAVRVSKSLINAAKTSHAVLDAHAHNSSADGTVAALHQAWSEPCKLMLCDPTNYYDMLGASYTHSLALLNMGVSADHMKVHTATRSMLEKRMQKFLAGHGSTFAARFIQTEGTFTEARLSQYSDALLNAVKATLVKVPLTYGVDAMLLSMVTRSEMQKFAVTPLQENALEALRNDNLVAYPDANKLREKMNLPPSSMDTEEDLDWEEPREDLLDITRRASEDYSHHRNLDRSLARKGVAKVLTVVGDVVVDVAVATANTVADVAVDAANGLAAAAVAVGNGIAVVGQTIGNGVVKGFTAMGEAIVTVGQGIYQGVQAFVDFIVSLLQCFGAGAVAKVGYKKRFPPLLPAPTPPSVGFAAITLAVAVLAGITNLLKGKLDVGVGIELSVVFGVCPGVREASVNIGFGIGLSFACTTARGCLASVAVGIVASANLFVAISPRCPFGPTLFEISDCTQTFGIVVKLMCCEVNILTGCNTCKGGGCDGNPVVDAIAEMAADAIIDALGTNPDSYSSCVETISGTNGAGYRGCRSNTLSHRICQKWSIQYPHTHGQTLDANGLGDHNYCRNPDNGATIWCYTMDATKRWEFCEVAQATVCAQNEGNTCACSGQVLYGKKFVSGKPGSGTTTTLEQLKQSGFKEKTVSGSVSCSNNGMGGDPIRGYYKWCYCQAAPPTTTTTTTADSRRRRSRRRDRRRRRRNRRRSRRRRR